MLVKTNEDTLTIVPEMPENFDDDMEWDLSDIMFMLEMEGAKFVEYSCYMEHYVVFMLNGMEYSIDEYDARELSVGKPVEAHQPYWVIGNNG